MISGGGLWYVCFRDTIVVELFVCILAHGPQINLQSLPSLLAPAGNARPASDMCSPRRALLHTTTGALQSPRGTLFPRWMKVFELVYVSD